MADLNVNIGELQMNNPVMTASGTFGYGEIRRFHRTIANRWYNCKGEPLFTNVKAIHIRAWQRLLREC